MHADALAGMNPSTRRVYWRAWEGFAKWCAENELTALPADEDTVLNYIGYLAEETGCAPSSARVAVAAVTRVHRLHHQQTAWAASESVRMMLDALSKTRRADGWAAKQAATLLPGQARALLAAADHDGVRSSALISLMLYTGARVGELLAAGVSDVIEFEGKPVLQIIGPGRKRRTVPLVPAAYARLERYLKAQALPAGPLFASSTGRRLDPKQVRRVLLRCAERAGLDPDTLQRLTPHSTRATYAASNLAAGASLRDVQFALGHEDPRTTEKYDRAVIPRDRHPSTLLAEIIESPALG